MAEFYRDIFCVVDNLLSSTVIVSSKYHVDDDPFYSTRFLHSKEKNSHSIAEASANVLFVN